jgi:hypothetical protein
MVFHKTVHLSLSSGRNTRSLFASNAY